MLYAFTVAVNFIDLVVAAWLGIYIVTRSSRSLIAWLAGLTLFSLAGFFLNILLALNPPPSPASLSRFLVPLFWFWPSEAFVSGWGSWIQGWQAIPAIFFWHHLTVCMRPGSMNPWRRTRVIIGYLIAIAAILTMRYTTLVFSSASGDPLYLTTLVPGKLFQLFMIALLIFTVMSLINLIRSARQTRSLLSRKQLFIMVAATLTAGLSVPLDLAANTLDFPVPRVILSILLGCSVFLIGYGVARYSALMEGRIIGRDLIHNGVAIALVAAVYLLVVRGSVVAYGVPVAAVGIVVVLAILTHSLVDISRRVLDLFFYRRETRELRAKLRSLVHQVSESDVLDETLSVGLDGLCTMARATYGIILLSKEDKLHQAATYRWRRGHVLLHPQDLLSDDASRLVEGQLPPPLEDAALLIPLYVGEEQTGALILGRPENGLQYSTSDVERLLDLSDHLADAVRSALRENQYLTRLAQLAEAPNPGLDSKPDELPIKVLEDALRNLHDYAYLGDSELAKLKPVERLIPTGGATHLDRGKFVHQFLLEALEKLRPSGDLPREPIPRQWYAYLILHEAYVGNMPNRDIMLRLYISEGTFNRTRRAAIRSLARALTEMDHPP